MSQTPNPISQRFSKKEQWEMKRQLDIMINRLKMLDIFKKRLQGKQIQTENKLEHFSSIRNQYQEYLNQQKEHKEFRDHTLDQIREKTRLLKQQQLSLKLQIRESVLQQKKQQFEEMKRQSLNHDKVITIQKERSKSQNMEKKQKVQQYEQQQQVNLALYKQQKQEQFRSQHKKAVLDSYRCKAQDFMKIQQLWEQEQDILDSLNDSEQLNISTLKS